MSVIRDLDELDSAMAEVAKQDRVVIDTETTGLKPWQGDELCGIGISWGFGDIEDTEDTRLYIPYRHRDGAKDSEHDLVPENLPLSSLPVVWDSLNEVPELVGWNVKFDLAMMFQDGFMPRKDQGITECIMAARMCTGEQHADLSLKGQTRRHLGEVAASYDAQFSDYLRKNKWSKHYDYAEIDVIAPYCERDCVYAGMLLDIYRERIEETEQGRVWATEGGITRVLWEMESTGVGTDLEYVESQLEPMRERLAEVTAKIYEYAGQEFNINSSQQLNKVMGNLGVKSTLKTDKGAPSWAVKVLAGVKHPIANAILEKRGLSKLVNDYFEKALTWDDGVQHPLFKNWGTITGRMSCTDPNLHSVAKNPQDLTDQDETLVAAGKALVGGKAVGMKYTDEQEGLVSVRRMYVPREGYKLYMLDYCLAEGTQVETPSGDRTIEALQAGDLVYGHDGQKPSVTKVVAKRFSGRQICYEVGLDNGKSFTATEDHKVPVIVGDSWEKTPVKSLFVGQRVLPFRRGQAGPGCYKTLYSHSNRVYTYEHVAVAEAAHGSRPDGHHVHHVDSDNQNNSPENLVYMEKSAHTSMESSRHYSSQDHTLRLSRLREALKNRDQSGERNPNYGKRGVDSPSYGQDRGGHRQACLLCGAEFKCRPSQDRKYCSRQCYATARKRGLNHKIVSIREVGARPTWDIEVEDERHVFALSCGVYTSNSQMEMRIFADYVKDDALSALCEDPNFDFHDHVAEQVWGVAKADEQWDFYRFKAKGINFGLVFGMGINALSIAIASTKDEAKRYKAEYFDRFPRAYEFIDLVSKTVEQRGWIRNRFNRRYWIDHDRAYVGVNYLIQGTGADIVKESMVEIRDFLVDNGFSSRQLIQVHDEIILEAPDDEMAVVLPEIKSIMEKRRIETYLPVEVSVGEPSWAQKADVELLAV